MSTFYGTIHGCRGAATRCGTRNSGMRAAAQSYNGSLIATVSNGKEPGTPRFEIEMNSGSSCYGHLMISGTFEEVEKLLNYAQMHRDEILGEK